MILINGVAAEDVAATDRGLAYGDGVFRTLLLINARACNWQLHYSKLAADCAALGIECPANAVLADDLARLANQSADAVIKIIITRGSGARGYAPPQPASPTRIVLSTQRPDYPGEYADAGVEVRVCDTRLSFQPRLAGVKHLNRLENVLARAEWSDRGVPEGVMLDVDGNAVGGTMTNLFIVENGTLVTPDLTRCGVAGVTRARIMQAAARAGVRCREELLPLARLLEADETVLVNSVIGVWRVRACQGRRWQDGSVSRRMREWLDDEGD